MSDVGAENVSEVPRAEVDELRFRAESLEKQLSDLQRDTESKLLRAALKSAAVQAGIIDLDGLKLLDTSGMVLNGDGEVEGGIALMASFRRMKPWLFSNGSSSSTAGVPPAPPPKAKLATEMTDEEYRAARAVLLKRRN